MENFFDTVNKVINSPLWTVAFYVFVFCLVLVWLALVFWTLKDARKRIEDPLVIGVAVLTSFVLPYMGTLIYAILRPSEYLADARERELEMRVIEQELEALRACPSCGQLVRGDFLVCPSCRRRLRTSCVSCGRVLEPAWKVCPYCGEEQKIKRVPPPVTDVDEGASGFAWGDSSGNAKLT